MDSVELPMVDCQPRVRRSTYIANHLRDMIFEGRLKPGDRLPTEEQLCKHFGVSRTTLRESVQMLRVSGLLDVTPGRGSFIRMPDPSLLMKDLALVGKYGKSAEKDVPALRALLEVDMVRRACDSSLDMRKELHNHVVSRQADVTEVERVEKGWHMQIARLSGNAMGVTILEALISMQKFDRMRRFKDADETMRAMSMQIRINSAIMDGDKTAAMRLMSGYMGDIAQAPSVGNGEAVSSSPDVPSGNGRDVFAAVNASPMEKMA